MIDWKIHHREVTVSTNLDACAGRPGDVFTADFQTAGRGRLDHTWLSPPRTNLMMSAVLSVEGLSPEQISTLPLVVGLAVATAIGSLMRNRGGLVPRLKWPNDVLLDGRKVSGILCERVGDVVIAGIGVNVKPQQFSSEIANGACFLGSVPIETVRDAVLAELGKMSERWREGGFSSLYDQIVAIDWLKGKSLAVLQTDQDREPLRGICGGILADGSLDVGGVSVYAGEAHVEAIK